MAKAKKKAEPEVQDIKLEDLEQAVDEVNKQLDLDPGIEKGSDAHMRKELKEAMTDEDLFEGDEEFTRGTYDVLEALGIEHDCVKVKDAVADVDVDENSDDGEEEVVITDASPRKKQERTAKKENKKEETAMKTKRINAKKKKAKRLVSKKNVVKKNSRINNTYSRSGAFVDSLSKKGVTRQQLIEKADSLYVKHGGKSNIKNGAESWFGIIMPAFLKIDFVKKDGDKYVIS